MRPDRSKMIARMKEQRPTRKAVAAALAAQAPPDWQPPVREKKRRKLVEDSPDGIGGSDIGDQGAPAVCEHEYELLVCRKCGEAVTKG